MKRRRKSATAQLPESGLLSYWLVTRRQNMARRYLRGTVLDFGCGGGGLAEVCDPGAYVGFDIDPRMIEIARREWPQHRFETTIPEGERFDTVAALALIEHVPDPTGYLKQFSDLARPGGRIVLTTPHPSLEWVHTVGAKFGVFSQHAHEGHEDLIDRTKMESLLADTSMRLTAYRRFLLGANQLFVITTGNT